MAAVAAVAAAVVAAATAAGITAVAKRKNGGCERIAVPDFFITIYKATVNLRRQLSPAFTAEDG